MRRLAAGLCASIVALAPAVADACPCGGACHCWPTLAIVASFALGLGTGAVSLWAARRRTVS